MSGGVKEDFRWSLYCGKSSQIQSQLSALSLYLSVQQSSSGKSNVSVQYLLLWLIYNWPLSLHHHHHHLLSPSRSLARTHTHTHTHTHMHTHTHAHTHSHVYRGSGAVKRNLSQQYGELLWLPTDRKSQTKEKMMMSLIVLMLIQHDTLPNVWKKLLLILEIHTIPYLYWHISAFFLLNCIIQHYILFI